MALLCKGSSQPQRLTEGLTTTYSKPEGALSYALRFYTGETAKRY